MPRRRKAAEGATSKGAREPSTLPLEARDLSEADPYEVRMLPEQSRTHRQKIRRPSTSKVEQAAERDRLRTKTRRREDGAEAAALVAGAGMRRLSSQEFSSVLAAERASIEGPLDAYGRHPSLRKLSQIVLPGNAQASRAETDVSLGNEQVSRGGTDVSQSMASSEARQRVRAGRRSGGGGGSGFRKPRPRSPMRAAAGEESPPSKRR